MELKNQKCQACSGNTPKFDEKQISDNLSKLNSWSVNDEQKMIYKKFNFKTFKQALTIDFESIPYFSINCFGVPDSPKVSFVAINS